MLAEWGDYWKPDERELDEAFGSANRRIVEQFAGTIAAAAFWPAPGEADLGKPESQYCQLVNDLIEEPRDAALGKGPPALAGTPPGQVGGRAAPCAVSVASRSGPAEVAYFTSSPLRPVRAECRTERKRTPAMCPSCPSDVLRHATTR